MKKTNVQMVTLAVFITTFMSAIEELRRVRLLADDGCFNANLWETG